jgi:dipeptidyl-peptidase-4
MCVSRWPNFPKQFAQTRRFSSGRARSFVLSPANNLVFFVRAISKTDLRLALFCLDAVSGKESLLINPQDLKIKDEEFLPAQEKARRERLRESGSGITTFSIDRSGENLCFALNGELWYFQVSSRKISNLEIPGAIIDPRFSPNGKYIAGVVNGGLYLYSVAENSGRTLIASDNENVTYGLVDFIAAEELNRYRGFWWSPESTSLVMERVDESEVTLVNLADPTDPKSEVRTHRYPFAGTKNPSCEFYVIDLMGNKNKLDIDSQEFEYVTEVDFYTENLVHLTLLTRDQKNMVLKEFNLSSNNSKDLWARNHKSWVEVTAGAPRLFENHLISLEGKDNRQLFVDGLAITDSSFDVRSILALDKQGIFLQISKSQSTSALIFVDWKGQITPVGPQDAFISGGRKEHITLIVEANETSWARKVTVINNNHKFEIKDEQDFPEFNPRIEFFEAGKNKISTSVVFPTWLKDEKKLPVIVAPYGGPHFASCMKNAATYISEQWLADQGFIVIVAENRGTPGRGQNWEYEIFENWSEKILEDQITVLDETDKKYPGLLDLNNVGITGWSFGGYFAALAVLDAPNRFHAAIAGAPVTDLRWYDTAYSERYLGNPTIDESKYEQFSLINRAHKLTRPLLLIHGLADDNVLAMHTLKFSAKLLAEGKLHQFIPLSGVSHMTPQEVITENLLRMQLDFFKTNLVR